MTLDLAPLESYRLVDFATFRWHCQQPAALVAGVRTEGNGLVIHRATCPFLQQTIVMENTDLTTWKKYGISEGPNWEQFQSAAHTAHVRLFFTCPNRECSTLPQTLDMQ